MLWRLFDDNGDHLLLFGSGGDGAGSIVLNDVALKDTDLVLEKQIVRSLAVANVAKLLGRIFPCKLEQNTFLSYYNVYKISLHTNE